MKIKVYTIGFDDIGLGENPLWDEKTGLVNFLDIKGKKRIVLNIRTLEATYIPLKSETGSMALCRDGKIIYAMKDGIYTEDMRLIAGRPQNSGERFNDGKVSPDGRYFVGTLSYEGKGSLFCLEKGKLTAVLQGVTISNGLDWSIDGKRLYYCDTATQKIVEYSYPDFKEEKTLIDFGLLPDFVGKPDGLCIDCEGNLWVAIWGGGSVVKIDTKKGKITETVKFPAKYISCPAFIGEKLDKVFVTSAKGDDDSGYGGNCFLFKPNACGRKPFLADISEFRKGI